ncbi:histidine kinase [Actinoplanes sp. KI2]|uniref:sensor histidine kinase n=1 Tax=Actinoplanes sp. KI2 TaxID=2983315 RepID=UPI0021D579E8|nr:histidine kinase [Actinoplanes sp. KI2]MCU7723899.1 histidine kinase [Actinoplanes sp. KI2]
MTSLRRLNWYTLLACLTGVVLLTVIQPGTTAARAAVFAVVVPVCVVAGRLLAVPVLGTPPPPTAMTIIAALAAAGLLLYSRITGEGGFPWVLPLAVVLAGVPRPAWRLWPAGAALAFAASLAGGRHLGGALSDLAVTALCTAGVYAQLWMCAVADRLDRARHTERTTAVTGERRRFAAELHDIQGHNLQVIALKSELAERLAGTDPARAAEQMREVQELARQALGDTRELVRGYRAVSLDTEIANAARVLDAAGIRSSISLPPDPPVLPPAVENLLGLVVRECTTNVLRHSTAARCEIALTGDVALRFVNDNPFDGPDGPAGGLAGLRDRLTAAGGSLRFRRTDGEFTVTAALPMAVVR